MWLPRISSGAIVVQSLRDWLSGESLTLGDGIVRREARRASIRHRRIIAAGATGGKDIEDINPEGVEESKENTVTNY